MAWVTSLTPTRLIFVNLHHIDTGQILLHLLAIFYTLPVDHVVDVLNLVRAHTGQVLLRRGVTLENGLVNR